MTLLAFFKKKSNRGAAGVFCLATLFAVYAFLYATEEKHNYNLTPSFHQSIDKKKVQSWLNKFEELKWFSTAQSSKAPYLEMPSQIAFDQPIASFDRVWLTDKTLEVILDGKYEDYLEFISLQTKENRLSWIQFQDLQAQGRMLIAGHPKLNSTQMRKILEFAIVLGEIGHTETARKKAWVYEIVHNDHREFVEKSLDSHPEIFPSFASFSTLEKQLLIKLMSIAHFDNVTSLNGAEAVFEQVKQNNIVVKNPEVFDLALFLYVCQLAGSRGDKCYYSSPILTTHAIKNSLCLRKSFFILKDKSPEDAYHYYLKMRANWLGFDPGSPLNRVLTKIAAVISLYTEAEGKVLKEAFLKLKPEELTLIVGKFDGFNNSVRSKELLQIAELLLAIKQNSSLGSTEKDKLSSSIQIAFSFIARVLNQKKSATELDFSKITQIAVNNPNFLTDGVIEIDGDGMISINLVDAQDLQK